MTSKSIIVGAAALILALSATPAVLAAGSPQQAAPAVKPPELPTVPVRVDVVLNRFQGDKKTSSLPFSLYASAGPRMDRQVSMRMGIDVPIEVGQQATDPHVDVPDLGEDVRVTVEPVAGVGNPEHIGIDRAQPVDGSFLHHVEGHMAARPRGRSVRQRSVPSASRMTYSCRTPPRFEDGFMVLLRQAVGERPAGGALTAEHPRQATGEVVEEAGWRSLVDLAALLSINLAILNILPLPMLDGGRMAFVLIEVARRGRRISPQKEAMVHLVGMVALLLLVVVLSYFDVARIVRGDTLFR